MSNTYRTARSLVILIAMGLLPSLLFSQAKLKLSSGTEFDFGEIYKGKVVDKKIAIQNDGTDTLHISNVSTSCGCTATMLSRSDIPPSDTGSLLITFNSKTFNGKVEKAVTFETNDSTQKKVRIIFHANITTVIELSPDHVFFNLVKIDSANVKSITLTNVSKSPLVIKSISSDRDDLQVEVADKIVRPGYKTTFTCTLTPKDAGLIKGTITITTNNEFVPEFSLRYFAEAK